MAVPLSQVPYGQNTLPQDTITFATETDVGIRLGDAILGSFNGLLRKDEAAFTPEMGVNAKIGLRIQVSYTISTLLRPSRIMRFPGRWP